MRELVWSDDLAQEVLVTNERQHNEERYVSSFFYIYDYHFVNFLDDASKIHRNADKNLRTPTTHYLFPLVEEVGCNQVVVRSWNVTYCFFSPGIPEKYTRDRNLEPKYIFLDSGEAGSKCDYGYEDNDGLCKYTGATTSTVATTTVTQSTVTTTEVLTTTVPTTTVTPTVTTTTKKRTPKTTTASITVPNQNVIENSENDVSTEPSSSYSIFSLFHILMVLGFGYSIFT
ncbi:hypothetical protein B9Z55_007950 [Caenorhabditis nigoni]|nr:hypothetical protein B9Z55_007950 [Caenorhabditis nigoni]